MLVFFFFLIWKNSECLSGLNQISQTGEWLGVRGTEVGAKCFSSDHGKGHHEEKMQSSVVSAVFPWP